MRREPITVLAIDDDPGDAELLRRSLSELPEFEVRFVHAANPEQAGRDLSSGHVDVAFLDYQLGPKNGLDVLHAIRAAGDHCAVIALTGRGDEYAAASLILGGADDYVVKRDLAPAMLRKAIVDARGRHRQRVAERKAAEQTERLVHQVAEMNVELSRLNRHDPLTGLLNRQAWDESVTLEHERSSRHGHAYGVIMIDIDFFKLLNDSCGHPAGDACLQRIADCIAKTCRRLDMSARYGGEEFIVLAPETGLEGAERLAERLRRAIEECKLPHPASPISPHVTASVGVAIGPASAWKEVVKQADEALYLAKRQGRNAVALYGGAPTGGCSTSSPGSPARIRPGGSPTR